MTPAPETETAEDKFQKKVTDLLAQIRRRFNFLVASTGALLVCLLVVAVYVAITTSRTHDALCTFQSDLVNRVQQTEDFIAHPDKYPGIHIDPAQLQQGLENQKRTIIALRPLHC